MENKSFTTKLVDFLLSGGMPSAKGKDAKESGLILLHSDATAPVCATYGSSAAVSGILAQSLRLNQSLETVVLMSVCAYIENDPSVLHSSDAVKFLLKRLEEIMVSHLNG